MGGCLRFKSRKWGKVMENSKKRELVCIFLGLEFYTTPQRARILKTEVTTLLLKSLAGEELIGVDVQPAVDLTPSFSKIFWEKRQSKKE